MARTFAVVAAVAAFASSAFASPALSKRDHLVRINNRCGSRSVTPVYHDVSGTSYNMRTLAPGESTETSVGEAQLAWRIWGEDGKGCGWPDGGGCLLFECSFDNPNFRQCNLSRVDGYNMGISFGFDDPSCGGNECLHSDCPGENAFSDPTNGGPSLRQCNTPNVSMWVTFSCD